MNRLQKFLLVSSQNCIKLFHGKTRNELPALLGTPLVDGYMEKKLANVQEAMYSLVAPHELLTVTSGYGPSCIFYTDGSVIEGCAGFAVHQMGMSGFGYKIQGPAGVFTAELSALFTALRHIAEDIRPPERCLILTDSLSSIRAIRLTLWFWCM
jgi:hypothetical protein